jgi:hypothetical protein
MANGTAVVIQALLSLYRAFIFHVNKQDLVVARGVNNSVLCRK